MNKIARILLLFIFPLSVLANDFTLEHLMSMLAAQTKLEAQFKEQKFDSYLEIPITSRGQVIFIAPDYLKKTSKGASTQSLVLKGDQITISMKEGESKTFAIDQQPEMRAITESFRSTLSGDLETLMKFYTTKLTGQQNQWELLLTPIDKNISRAVKEIQFSGKNNQVVEVVTRFNNGDYSILEFSPTATPDNNNQ